jgi:predicted dehydrogenase
MLLRFDNGASGVLIATQVAVGEENSLAIRVYGDQGGIAWHQVEPNSLVLHSLNGPAQTLRAGSAYLSATALSNSRTPPGHPEGYLEAFSNIYAAFGRAVRQHQRGTRIDAREYDFPDVGAGARGMAFIDCVIRSAQSTDKWTQMP